MPAPVRRSPAVLLTFTGILLSWSSVASAGNGGFAPVEPVSPNAERTEDVYYLMSAFAILVFLVVTVPLVIFIVRYRSRGRARTVEGPQIRGNTRLELGWTLAPIAILIVIAGYVFYKLPGITSLTSAEGATELNVKVIGHQFYWEYEYPNGVVAIDRLRAPVDRLVHLDITAPEGDVNHSFWIPAAGGKFDAIPGRTTEFEFEAQKIGTYPGQCAEFCGVLHGDMTASLDVLPAAEFDRWLEEQARAQEAGESELGQEIFQGACAKCHGMRGEGLIAPALAGNPVVENRQSVEEVVRNGLGQMPAVGQDWGERQLDAVVRYLDEELGGQSGG
jgi:cytochrome c oxidase subunit II